MCIIHIYIYIYDIIIFHSLKHLKGLNPSKEHICTHIVSLTTSLHSRLTHFLTCVYTYTYIYIYIYRHAKLIVRIDATRPQKLDFPTLRGCSPDILGGMFGTFWEDFLGGF